MASVYNLFIISLHSAKTKELVDEYEQQCQHFMMNQFKESLFLALNTSSKLPDGRVLVTLKLLIKCTTATVNDLRELVTLFGVHCYDPKYHEGCITITGLYFSTKNSNDLITKNREVPQVFYEEELTESVQSQHEPGIILVLVIILQDMHIHAVCTYFFLYISLQLCYAIDLCTVRIAYVCSSCNVFWHKNIQCILGYLNLNYSNPRLSELTKACKFHEFIIYKMATCMLATCFLHTNSIHAVLMLEVQIGCNGM